jgi:hypothetical protein
METKMIFRLYFLSAGGAHDLIVMNNKMNKMNICISKIAKNKGR